VCADGVFCVFASTGSWDGTFVQMGFTVEDTEATMAELRSRSIVSRSTAFPGLPMVNGIVDVPGNYPSNLRAARRNTPSRARHDLVTPRLCA
jgi:hypothetical protein